MTELSKYHRRSHTTVIAVQLALETDGFTYRKWGATQACKPGDWIVDNGRDVYTVDRDTFDKTYERVGRGEFRKKTVWARVAISAGSIRTKEGETHYEAGDYLVFNDPEGQDGYAIGRAEFERLYESDS